VTGSPPPSLEEALGAYVESLDEWAPGLVEGVYVVGSAALGDWQRGHSDVDIVAVTAEPATDEDFASIRAAHVALAGRQPQPWVDGPYVAWGDLVVEPATGLHRPWVLHDDVHHDGECFEINPVTWFTLEAYGLIVRGPDPREIGVATDAAARVRFVAENLDTYWRAIGERIPTLLDADAFTTADLEWCALGPLRLHHTLVTADVTSKRGAGEYGLAAAPTEYHGVIRHALAIRAGTADGPVGRAEMAAAGELILWAAGDAARWLS